MIQVNIDYLEECAKEDNNLRNYLNSKIRKLPREVRYFMGNKMYIRFYMKTFISYMRYLFKNNPDLNLFITKRDNECLGWVAFEANILGKDIFNIRFGSFYYGDSDLVKSNNRFFMQDLRKTFVDFFNNGISASFISDKKNPFIKHYYRYVKEVGGSFSKKSRRYISFRICKADKADGDKNV